MTIRRSGLQEDLQYFEAKEDEGLAEEEFYGGGGQVRDKLEHFPRLWCPEGTYSIVGQAWPPFMSVGVTWMK